MEGLKDRIKEMIWSGRVGPEMVEAMINARHLDALRRARVSIENSITSLERLDPLELTALDLRIATAAVGEIVGKTTTDDLLDAIFSKFCIGK